MKIIFPLYARSPRIPCRKIVFNKSGVGMIEYALIVALVMLVCIVGMSTLSHQGINPTFQTAKEGLESTSS